MTTTTPWMRCPIAAPRAPFLRRLIAWIRGIKRRMFIGKIRRTLAQKIRASTWQERHETAVSIWERPDAAEAFVILLRWRHRLAG